MRGDVGYPRQRALTQGFTLGAPRSFTLAPDGRRVAFLRSVSASDPATGLWVLDTATGRERLAAGPGDAEQARTGGAASVDRYSADRELRTAVAVSADGLWNVDLSGTAGAPRPVPVRLPARAARVSPDGTHVAYVHDGALRVTSLTDARAYVLAVPESESVSYGLPEWVAREEMRRPRGYWWSPRGDRILTARVDTRAVPPLWIADPADPASPPRPLPFPRAGAANAEVRLRFIGLDRRKVAVDWDREAFPYLAAVHWDRWGPPLALVQSRDQRRQHILALDEETGATTCLLKQSSGSWCDIVAGTPAWDTRGRLIAVAESDGSRCLTLDGRRATGPGLDVAEVVGVSTDGVLFTARPRSRPGTVHLHLLDREDKVRPVSKEDGSHTGVAAAGALLLVSRTSTRPGSTAVVTETPGGRSVAEIRSLAARPGVRPRPAFVAAGERRIPCAVFLPRSFDGSTGPLPVLLDPYGGPTVQRVRHDHDAHLTSQWFADHGFAVVVADGRGTPGRGTAWEREISGGFREIPLADQIDALHALARTHPLDLSRVAVRGWSFGGYLAALAALTRGDVFHAAVAGAPVTDWRLYDTHYTERYLGHPDENPDAYRDSDLSLLAEGLAVPLMLIHGTADDNVFPAHSMRLSAALTAAGRPHTVLPLPGMNHMITDTPAIASVLPLEMDFLARALGMPYRADVPVERPPR
ncbi:prolyl oligopeptidase family serine peptidase [Streptomyces sp. NPDC051976]|uniref:S9 family peptidase n=1 Tax=Streptomyces sp. NPDC051976 TaxID=3154947 RepID=UPI00343B128A